MAIAIRAFNAYTMAYHAQTTTEPTMPISQDRLVAVLEASREVLGKLKALRHAAMELSTRADDATLRRAAERLWEYASGPCAPTIECVETISQELGHFNHARLHKNRRDAALRRTKRGMAHPGDSEYATHAPRARRSPIDTLDFADTGPERADPFAPQFTPDQRAALDETAERLLHPKPKPPELRSPRAPDPDARRAHLEQLARDGALDEDDSIGAFE